MKEFINKLIERLEEELKLADEVKEKCARENPLMFDNAKGYATGIANAKSFVNQLAEEYDQTIDVAELVEKFGQEKVRSNDGWIPCSERLPRIGEQVMVCNRYGSVFVSHITYLNPRVDKNGECHDFGSHYKVIAWQPLPAPYQPKGE